MKNTFIGWVNSHFTHGLPRHVPGAVFAELICSLAARILQSIEQSRRRVMNPLHVLVSQRRSNAHCTCSPQTAAGGGLPQEVAACCPL